MPNDQDEPLLTCEEVANKYRVSVLTVRRWVRKEIIGHVRVGPYRVIRIPLSEARRHFVEVKGAEV